MQKNLFWVSFEDFEFTNSESIYILKHFSTPKKNF
jgi:hypothetical protein